MRPRDPVEPMVPPMAVMVAEMQPEKQPEPAPGGTDPREAQFKARYARVQSRYSAFRQAHGEILASQWSELRSHLFNMKSSPDYYPVLEQKLNAFEAQMKQYGH